jgi:hypothetical protein
MGASAADSTLIFANHPFSWVCAGHYEFEVGTAAVVVAAAAAAIVCASAIVGWDLFHSISEPQHNEQVGRGEQSFTGTYSKSSRHGNGGWIGKHGPGASMVESCTRLPCGP